MIEFNCPHCEKLLHIDDKYAGQTGKCTHCGKPITVEGTAPVAPQESPLKLPPNLPPMPPVQRTPKKSSAKPIIIGCAIAFVAVSMFVVVVLAAILIPAAARANDAAKRASCANNLKQLGLVFRMYSNESKGQKYPPLSPENGRLMFSPFPVYPEYMPDPEILLCPADEDLQSLSKYFEDGHPEGIIDDHSYFYLGYAIIDEEGLVAFAEAYETHTPEASGYDAAFKLPEGKLIADADSIFRLREGVARFMITDINNPSASAYLESSIPVLIERPDNHTPAGGNVLYMDGHVEYKEYPGEWPMTEKTIAILEKLDGM